MKRDFDLVRAILRHLAQAPGGSASISMPAIEGYAEDEIGYHAHIMAQAGLVEIANHRSKAQFAIPVGVTWAGHDFLGATKDGDVWAKAKANVIGPAGVVAFSVLLEWLKAQAMAKLGLPLSGP